jgi:hypothetical protein
MLAWTVELRRGQRRPEGGSRAFTCSSVSRGPTIGGIVVTKGGITEEGTC